MLTLSEGPPRCIGANPHLHIEPALATPWTIFVLAVDLLLQLEQIKYEICSITFIRAMYQCQQFCHAITIQGRKCHFVRKKSLLKVEI